jgi:hypothetical protein
LKLKEKIKEKNMHSEQLVEVYYRYIGYVNVENIIQDQEQAIDKLVTVKTSSSMDEWFRNLLREHNKKNLRNILIKKSKGYALRAAVFLLLFFTAGTILFVSVEGFQHRVLNIILETKKQFTSIEIRESTNKIEIPSSIQLKGYYYPTYLPSGYNIEHIDSINEKRIITISNTKNQSIVFSQGPIGTNFQFDTENAKVQDITINGAKGILIQRQDKNTLFWHDNDFNYYILSELPYEEIIKIAESLEEK